MKSLQAFAIAFFVPVFFGTYDIGHATEMRTSDTTELSSSSG